VRQLASLIDAQLAYHRQSADILETLHESLERAISEIGEKPERVCFQQLMKSFLNCSLY